MPILSNTQPFLFGAVSRQGKKRLYFAKGREDFIHGCSQGSPQNKQDGPMSEEQLETLYIKITGEDETKERIMYMFLDVIAARSQGDPVKEPEAQNLTVTSEQ